MEATQARRRVTGYSHSFSHSHDKHWSYVDRVQGPGCGETGSLLGVRGWVSAGNWVGKVEILGCPTRDSCVAPGRSLHLSEHFLIHEVSLRQTRMSPEVGKDSF